MSDLDVLTATAQVLSALLDAGQVTSVHLVERYLDHISKYNDRLRGVISVPSREYVMHVAKQLDHERASGRVRSPLHGIPILIKVKTTIALSSLRMNL